MTLRASTGMNGYAVHTWITPPRDGSVSIACHIPTTHSAHRAYSQMVNIRRVTLLPIIALIVGALSFAPASADPGNPFDITSMEIGNVRVNSGACREIPMALKHNGGLVKDAGATIEVWSGRRRVDEQMLFVSEAGQITGPALICPTYLGFGVFRAGPSDISYPTPDFESIIRFRDKTARTFSVLQDSRVSKVKARRSGRTVAVTAKATFYDFYADHWRSVAKGTKYRLQRQITSGSWVNVKSGRVGKSGKILMKVKRSKQGAYRVKVNGDRQTWSATSNTVRR